MGRAKDKAPVLIGHGIDSLILGHTDPGALVVAGRQPLYLLSGAEKDAGPALDKLRYAVVDSTPNSSSGALQGLEFRDGLAQLNVAAIPAGGLATAINRQRFKVLQTNESIYRK